MQSLVRALVLVCTGTTAPRVLMGKIQNSDFRERMGAGRERDVKEKHWSLGSNPQPTYVPWLGIEPTTFWCMEWHSNQLSHPARAVQTNLSTHLNNSSNYIFDITMSGVSFQQCWQTRLVYNNTRTMSNITMTQQNTHHPRKKHHDRGNFLKEGAWKVLRI